ncbi:thioredoxin superfamily protein [Carex rostrata]
MLKFRRAGHSLLYGLRQAAFAPTRPTRSHPSGRFQYQRFCSNKTSYGDHKLEGPIHEDKEPSSTWGSYALPGALLVLAGVGTLIHYNDERRAISKEPNASTVPERVNTNRPAIGGPFKLYDTEGNEVTEASLRGKWLILYFGYTSSPDVDPQEVKKIADVTTILDSKYNFKITPVYVTLDPQRDSPAQLKAYLEEFDSRILGLTGSVAAVRQMAQEYRVFFRKVDEIGQDYLVECSHTMYLLDPNLETVRIFGVEYNPLELADAITAEFRKAQK